METFKNDFFADHYMPYSLSNFEEVDTPIVEFVIVSKVNKTLNGEKINKGDIIVRDKLKTWWLNCWTGSKGKGQELQWYEMAMFFRISGFYNDKWMIWENNGTPEDPKRQTGGWGNQKEFIFVDIC